MAASRSMKGWELYSWRDGHDLRFALVVGTNRNKTADEIKRAMNADLDKQLATLAKGEEVFWSAPAGFDLPDQATRQHVVELARRLGLTLTIAGG
jgi:hypothetical protein